MRTVFVFDDAEASLEATVAAILQAWKSLRPQIRIVSVPLTKKDVPLVDVAKVLIQKNRPGVLILGPGFSFPGLVCPGRELLLWLQNNDPVVQVAIATYRELDERTFAERYAGAEYVCRFAFDQKTKIADFLRDSFVTSAAVANVLNTIRAEQT